MIARAPLLVGLIGRAPLALTAAAAAWVLVALAALAALLGVPPIAAQAAPAPQITAASTPRPPALPQAVNSANPDGSSRIRAPNRAGDDDIAHFAVDRAGEKLRIPLPANWVPVAHLRAGDVRQTDYAPDNDVPRVNDERLRIEAVADASTDPGEFVTLLAKDSKQRCPELIATAMSSARENGYPTAVSLLDCPRAPGKGPPLLMLKVIRGEQWLYIIARTSTRADTRPDKQANERIRIADWAQFMRKLSLCHELRPDHACPRTRLP